VVFLAVVSVAVLFCCVNYLQLKSELTGKIKTVASLETELSQIKEDNNAYESQVTSDVDLNTIKKLAIGRLGMNYPKDDQKDLYYAE
jgi:cell division protein FtsL